VTLACDDQSIKTHKVRDMSGIWRDFVEVTRLEAVLAKMVELEASQDPYMLQVLTFLKGGKFEKISRWMWEDQNYKEVHFYHLPTRFRHSAPGSHLLYDASIYEVL